MSASEFVIPFFIKAGEELKSRQGRTMELKARLNEE
jgi:hypothetical protein